MELTIEKTTKYYKGNPVDMLYEGDMIHMVNMSQVFNIINEDLFKWLELETTKEFIKNCEGAKSKISKDSNSEIINIESSSEIYMHHIVIPYYLFKVDIEFYKWFYKVNQ